MIKRIIKRIFFTEQVNLNPHNTSNFKNLISGMSSKLLPSCKIRFDVEPEVREYVTIGENCIIGAQFIFESKTGRIRIGNNTHIGGGMFISRSSIIIGNDVTMAWDITIYDHDSHSIYWDYRRNDNIQCYKDYVEFGGCSVINKNWENVKSAPIVIHDKVWIGFGVTVLKGVTIGEGAVVGAKSVVTKDVLPWTVVAGNPAKVIKIIEKE